MSTLMNSFPDMQSNKDAVIKAGVAIFQYIYHTTLGATLGAIRYHMFSKKAAVGVIKPEILPPAEGVTMAWRAVWENISQSAQLICCATVLADNAKILLLITEGAAVKHFLHACLQTRDWMLL